jgi:hypothetical protein
MSLTGMFIAPIGAALLASSVWAQTPSELLNMAPSSHWEADYADDNCALRREFGAGDNQVVLQLRQFAPGDGFEVTIVSRTLQRSREAPRVRFEPDEGFFEPSDLFGLDRGELRGIQYGHSLRPIAAAPLTAPLPDWPEVERDARERAVTGLMVKGGFEQDVLLQTGRMAQPMNAMRACMDNLLTQWGIDPAQLRSLSRAPKPIDLPSWSRKVQEGYPTDMVRAGRSSRVYIRLIVGADGKPSSCIPDKSSSETSFGEHACDTSMRHARFEPALDINGTPVASFYATSIIYQLF